MTAPLPKKKRIVIVAALALLVAGGWWGYKTLTAAPEALKLYGAIDVKTVELAFEESGRVKTLHFKEGDLVKKGDVVATLDDERHRIARDVSKSAHEIARAELTLLLAGARPQEIEAGRARLRAADAALALSVRNCDRQKKMGVASSAIAKDSACSTVRMDRAARDQAKKELEILEIGPRAEEIEVAKARVAQTKDALAQAELSLAKCKLISPIDGVVRAQTQEVGDMVTSSSTLYEVALTTPLWARVYIDEIHLGKIKSGQTVHVSVDSYPDEVFEATVGFISTVAEFTPRTVQTEAVRTSLVYEVRLTINDPKSLLRLGMPVTARLQ